MKTLFPFFWLINALFAGYLGIALQGTTSMQVKDYEGINKGIVIIDSLQIITKARSQKSFEKMYKNTEDEGVRPTDVAYLKKAFKVISMRDTTNKKLYHFGKFNQNNYFKINELVNNYELSLLTLDTAVQRSITPLIRNINEGKISTKSEFQKLQIANIQCYTQKLEVNATSSLTKKVGDCCCGFRKILVLPIPESRIVEEGQEYKARMVLIRTGGYGYTFAKNVKINNNPDLGGTAVVQENEIISFPAKADKYDAHGQHKRKWTAEITMRHPLSDSIYTIEREYIIKKKK